MMQPTVSSSPEALADWLEIRALKSADKNSSLGDLASELRRSGTADATIEDDEDDSYASDPRSEKCQAAAQDAFSELEDRYAACQTARGKSSYYAFDVGDGYIQLSHEKVDYVYLFLLLLSIFGKDAGPSDLNGEKLFEEVCAEAVKAYLGGEPHGQAAVFGFPRRILPSGFKDAVDRLCLDIGEGGGSRDCPTRRDQKDAKLDIVAWRKFSDGREGQIIAFGQCATGANWRDKTTELTPCDFCKLWVKDTFVVDPIGSFFVPFRVERKQWAHVGVTGGVLFDRCRIVSNTASLTDELRTDCKRWVETAIENNLSNAV